MPRSADGTAVLQHEHVIGRDVERGIVDARFEVSHIFEDEGGTAVVEAARVWRRHV